MFLRRVALALLLAASGQAGTITVQLLAINDFHGNLEPPTGSDGRVNQTPAGGAEYLATHLRNAVRSNANSIVIGAGDLIGASPLISGLLQDGPTIEAMNAMNMSVTSIGNHELDHGPAELMRRIAGAHFQYLAANVRGIAFTATAVRTVGGVRIGFIGETLEGTPQMLQPSSVEGLHFLEESAVANEAAAELERQGVHAIVLLIHEGGRQKSGDGPADPNGCANFEGPIKAIVGKLSSSIKVVISAHTHQFYNCEIAGHILTSAGSYGRLFTRVNLSIDSERDTILQASATNEIVTRDVAKDAALTAIIDKYGPGAARVANQPVGSTTSEISRKQNAAGESAMGDVIADAQLASVSAPDKGGAVLAFMNSGGIRADLIGHAVTYGDLFSVQPFANQVQVRTLTGDMIRRALEQQLESGAGGDVRLQVSEGFTYKYRVQAPAGQHVVAGSIALHGRTIAPADQLRVAASDFVFSGGGGITVLSEGINPTAGPVDVDALVDYFRTHSPVAPGRLNRIVRVD